MTTLPATTQLSILSREIGALTEKLEPAPQASIASYLLSMRKAGMTLPDGIKPEDLEAVYGYALSDVPAFGLKRAVEKLIKGEYEIKRGYIPKPPELAAMARAEAKVVRDDLVRLREKQTTLRDLQKSPEPISQASRDRVRAMLGRFRANREAATARHRGVPVAEQMSEEKAEYWRRIDELRDAPEITADQRAFRRKIEMDVRAGQDKE